MKDNTFPIIIFGDENLHPTQQSEHTAAGEMIDAILVKPGMYPQQIRVANDFDSIRANVAEHVEFMNPFAGDRSVTLVVNELSKIDGSMANRGLIIGGKMVDVICGDFLIVRETKDGDFGSLTQKQIDRYMEMFKTPHIAVYHNDQLMVVQVPDYLVIKP